ncbi:hypothetical protein EV198_2705 [Roseivirga ehrenbergii]|uniref:Lipid/polyisoprenoid-binding YceI-like domain-containing protein n=1 Tax=Roseivirga ehrenbergii (strain DSM 102268 / JCM 13514 / KCTC 12282 / NCIMB 14502 / KMM 6017) TaxID=279360 RepID=A0A150XTM5_ROSEK|nr:hypothetical protein [Roseivirga ehrenbergii]KYG82091.1 hypothetical protein MB14_01470 [Roseivirga ehrenbergii]TCL01914.1 hypothetical protein EV198_2705 [Roseivirga ehrenbergii]
MKAKWPFLIICLLLLSEAAFSQTYLVVRKKGSMRKYEYFVGSKIVYKQKGQEVFFTDRITEFADSTLVLDNNILHTSQITEIDVRGAESNRSKFLGASETLLPTVGIGLMAIDLFNHTVVDGQKFSLDRSTTTTAGILMLTGYTMKIARRKKVDLTNPKFEVYIVGLK